MIINGVSKKELMAITDDEYIGIQKGDYFDIGYTLELVYVNKETGLIAGKEAEDFDISDEYINNPSSYLKAWIII
jgi:hypothetical protein